MGKEKKTAAPPLPDELRAAGYVDGDDVWFVPRTAVHAFMVKVDAWLDVDAGLLMFVGAPTGEQLQRFLWAIGEEHNCSVVGVGKGVAAWQLDEDRVERVREKLARS